MTPRDLLRAAAAGLENGPQTFTRRQDALGNWHAMDEDEELTVSVFGIPPKVDAEGNVVDPGVKPECFVRKFVNGRGQNLRAMLVARLNGVWVYRLGDRIVVTMEEVRL